MSEKVLSHVFQGPNTLSSTVVYSIDIVYAFYIAVCSANVFKP